MYLRSRFFNQPFMKSLFHRRHLWLCLLMSLLLTPIAAQNRRHRIYEAYVNGNRSQWLQVINDMEHSSEPKTLSFKLELVEYYYGMVGYHIGMKRNDLAAPLLAKGNTLVENILKDYPSNATALAYKGSFTAFKISLNRYKVMVLGSESLKWMEKSLAADPDNIQGLFDRGNAYVHAPALFGGDVEQGIMMYRKAMSLMEKRNMIAENWLYLHLLATTADACKRGGHPEKAKPYYDRIQQVEPRFRLVKN